MSALPTRRLRTVPGDEPRLHFRTVHGYRRAFRIAGSGPPVLLIHGIGDDSRTWLGVMAKLARTHLVIAPDLLGHGMSDKPRADYSGAAYANGMRDLLGVLGIDRVSLVGHSLGGGVAMQFAYQFPEKTERLILVATGGAGRDVNPALRLASLPGTHPLLCLLRLPTARLQARLLFGLLRRAGTGLGRDAADLLRLFDAFPDTAARRAYLRTLRAVVDWRGQVITMLDRCYLTQGMPTLLIWGDRDAVLPVAHARIAHEAMPGSRLEIFHGAGHFPFHSDPDRFVAVVEEFISTTAPARWSIQQWRELLRTGGPGATTGELPAARVRFRQLRAASERSAT